MSVQFLDPEALAKISNLELIARKVVEGFITGLHKSPYHGFSVEFAEHRPYMPGDEIRTIDWKVYGRTSRFYVKRFEEETNLKCHILLDTSGSMAYGSAGITKFQYASYLAASLAHLMIHQKDAAGLALFDNKIQKYFPPRATRSYLTTLDTALQNAVTTEETRVGSALHAMAERIRRRGLIVVISDLMDEPEKILHGLKHFRHAGHDVLVFHVLDAQEIDLNFDGDIVFEDLETRERISTQPWHIKKAYSEEIHEFIETYRRGCREQNMDYFLINTKTPFDKALMEYLIKRARLG